MIDPPRRAPQTQERLHPGRPAAGFSIVKLAVDRASGKEYACKIMALPPVGQEVGENENTRWVRAGGWAPGAHMCTQPPGPGGRAGSGGGGGGRRQRQRTSNCAILQQLTRTSLAGPCPASRHAGPSGVPAGTKRLAALPPERVRVPPLPYAHHPRAPSKHKATLPVLHRHPPTQPPITHPQHPAPWLVAPGMTSSRRSTCCAA